MFGWCFVYGPARRGVRTVDANWEDWSTFWCIFTFLFLLSLFLFFHLDVVANRWVEFFWKWGQGGTFDDRLACLLLLVYQMCVIYNNNRTLRKGQLVSDVSSRSVQSRDGWSRTQP